MATPRHCTVHAGGMRPTPAAGLFRRIKAARCNRGAIETGS
jgi:hypothetical protein